MGCYMYDNLVAQELHQPGLNFRFQHLGAYRLRTVPYQESIFEEMARSEPFFTDYSGRKQLEVISDERLTELLGAPVRTAVASSLILYVSAQTNAGFFDPASLDQPSFSEVLEVVPLDRILAVIDSVFANSIEQFKEQATEAPPLPYLERYLFNPLTARPLLRLRDGRLLAPVLQAIGRKLSPIELTTSASSVGDWPSPATWANCWRTTSAGQLASMPASTSTPRSRTPTGGTPFTAWTGSWFSMTWSCWSRPRRPGRPRRRGQQT